MIKRLLIVAVYLTTALSALNLLPNVALSHEINRNLGCYYLALHLVTLVILVLPAFEEVRRRRFLFACALLLCLFYGMFLYPFYWPQENPLSGLCLHAGKCEKVKALFAHYPEAEGARKAFAQLIAEEAPGIVALVGAPAELPAIGNGYSSQVRTAQGLLILSKIALRGDGRVSLGDGLSDVLMVDAVVAKDRVLQLSLVDLMPLRNSALITNKLITRRILTQLRHNGRVGVLFGSFHVTPFSSFFDMFIWAARFENAANGFGLWYTWDGRSFFKRFLLDHVFVRGHLLVTRYEVLPLPDAAHQPIVVEFETPREVKAPWQMPADE